MSEDTLVMQGIRQEDSFNAGLCCNRGPGEEKLKAYAVEFEYGPIHAFIPISDWDRLVSKVQAERDSFAATGKF